MGVWGAGVLVLGFFVVVVAAITYPFLPDAKEEPALLKRVVKGFNTAVSNM